jgi:hypothetical protein
MLLYQKKNNKLVNIKYKLYLLKIKNITDVIIKRFLPNKEKKIKTYLLIKHKKRYIYNGYFKDLITNIEQIINEPADIIITKPLFKFNLKINDKLINAIEKQKILSHSLSNNIRDVYDLYYEDKINKLQLNNKIWINDEIDNLTINDLHLNI